MEEKVTMGKIHFITLFIFVLHVSFSMDIDVNVDQDFRWTEVNGMEPYETLVRYTCYVHGIIVECMYHNY